MATFYEDDGHSEWKWQMESETRGRAAVAQERRDMEEVELGPKCCDHPENYQVHESYERDPDTGYLEGASFECVCGTHICEEDYAQLCRWANNKTTTWPRIDENTCGPLVTLCDDSPIFPERKVA